MTRIMLPRVLSHLSLWGAAGADLHSCASDEPHDGPCVCTCGAVQPYGPARCPGE